MDNRLGFNLWSGKVALQQKTNRPSNLQSQWTTLDTIYLSKSKESVRVLVFLASILYGTRAFFMEVKEQP